MLEAIRLRDVRTVKGGSGLTGRLNVLYQVAETGDLYTWDPVGEVHKPAGSGGGPVGRFVSTAALQSAAPAASNAGRTALVGAAAPYVWYISDGVSWSALPGSFGTSVTLSASGVAFGTPVTLTKFQVVSGTGLSLTLYDNATAASGTVIWSGTGLASSPAEIVLPAGYPTVNGVYAAITGTGSFTLFAR